MVRGADKTKARKKRFVRTPTGTVTRYDERKSSKARCPSGRPLPGVASGSKNDIRKFSKSQRRPSRPFGGVLSAPVMRAVMREYAQMFEPAEPSESKEVFSVGRVCVKIAGRDAGKVCIVLKQDKDRVLVDGQTRRRLVNTSHLEPTGIVAKVPKEAKSEAVIKALKEIEVEVETPKKQREFSTGKKKPKKSAKKADKAKE